MRQPLLEGFYIIHYISVRNTIALLIIIGIGLGSALALPALANWQGYAAQSGAAEPDYSQSVQSQPRGIRTSNASSSDLIHAIEHAPAAFTDTYRVSKLGNGLNPTAGWTGAYNNLQDALGAAGAGDEIWVAAGIYTPGVTISDSFTLVPGVAVYGGFKGTEFLRDERDWIANPTILSGDIFGDDITDAEGVVTHTGNIRGNNSLNVVYAKEVTGTTMLDGFKITAGYAHDSRESGGGFHCDGSKSASAKVCSPNLRRIHFSGNSAESGGGLHNDGLEGVSSPTLRDVIFTGNYATLYGGALVNYAQDGKSSPVMTNVIFSSNSAGVFGGAIANFGHLYGTSHPILINATFSGNSATDKGGGIFNYGKDGTCLPIIRNSIIWNNRDSSGTGTLTANIYNQYAKTTLYHSLAQGTGGTGSFTTTIGYGDGGDNIDKDPKFAAPIDPIVITSTSDLHLQIDSPAIDAGDNDYVIDVLTDLDGQPRVKDGDGDGEAFIDMGAYEVQLAYSYKDYLSIIFR